jgi:hypothetical protein
MVAEWKQYLTPNTSNVEKRNGGAQPELLNGFATVFAKHGETQGCASH